MLNDPQAPVLFFLVFCCTFLGLTVLTGAGREINRKRAHINAHEKKKDSAETTKALLARMRHDRGLSKDGYINTLNYNVGRLIMQSGLSLRAYMIYIMMFGLSFLLGAGLYFFKSSLWLGIFGFGFGLALPILVLRHLVKRRQRNASRQLPDALDVIIRSLKAGHPVPVALSLVGREMPDPIGSEFAMASDELGFGGSVSTAIQRMADRIGQEDFDLFAAMIRLQEKTGGNLAELLEGNANTIRARQRIRLKIKASSAEGRMSALILNAAPVCVYLIIRVIAPDFYGDVSDSPIMKSVIIGVIGWMIIGNLVIRRMINFKV